MLDLPSDTRWKKEDVSPLPAPEAILSAAMKVVMLIAGAGGMYCGSCLRDNRLAATLREQGRDVLLVPLYTPIRTDEQDISEHKVQYGGVSVFLQQKSSLFRRTPAAIDRLLDSPALLRGVGRLAVKTKAGQLGPLTVSVLKGPEGRQAKELRKLISMLESLEPDVVHLPNLMMVGLAESLKSSLGAAVVCSLSGEDIFLDALIEPFRSQAFALIRKASDFVDGFAAPTRYYGGHAASHFDLPAERMHHVPMGIRVEDFSAPSGPPDGPLRIGYFARICPEKGLDRLADAFVRLRHDGHDCRLVVGGYLGAADRPYFENILRNIQTAGLSDHFEHWGEVGRAEKISLLQSLHVFSVPTVYHEAKGLYLLEAMAAGVPVVMPRQGSFPELVELVDGGLLYHPARPDSLSESLAQMLADRQRRSDHADQARKGAREHFNDRIMAEKTWRLYEQLAR